jgi:hypothetical protein
MNWRSIANLDAKVFAVPLEGATSKLGPIVGDDPVWNPESIPADGVGERPHDVQPPHSKGP